MLEPKIKCTPFLLNCGILIIMENYQWVIKALATHAKVTIHDNNSSTITVQFVPMDFNNMHGHLQSLSIYSSPLFSGDLTAASVDKT